MHNELSLPSVLTLPNWKRNNQNKARSKYPPALISAPWNKGLRVNEGTVPQVRNLDKRWRLSSYLHTTTALFQINDLWCPLKANSVSPRNCLDAGRGGHFLIQPETEQRSFGTSVITSAEKFCLSVRLYVCPSIHPPTHLPTYTPTHPSIHPSIHRSIYLSIYLSLCLSIYLSTLHPQGTVLLNKVIFPQIVKKFVTGHGTRRFMNVFTTARHLALYRARLIQSFLWTYFFKTCFNIIPPSIARPFLPLSQRSSLYILLFSPIYATFPAHHILLHFITNKKARIANHEGPHYALFPVFWHVLALSPNDRARSHTHVPSMPWGCAARRARKPI